MKKNLHLPLPPADDLFSSQETREDAKLERVQVLPIAEIVPFQDHPFKIQDNQEMRDMIESIKNYGIYTPALARPKENGGYELVSGHRRLAACQVLGIENMPVMVREMTDDEAVIAMVDANLQREHILPSEKAFAYRMKLDAIKHQGKTSTQVGEKLLSVEKIGQEMEDSREQVRRYIRLTNLIPELLQMVDDSKIAFNPAVELSYLKVREQKQLLSAMEKQDCTPSHAQAIHLKKLSQMGALLPEHINQTLSQTKPNQVDKLSFSTEDLRSYFPKSYSKKQMEDVIIKLLNTWKNRQRDRDSR